MEYKDHHRRELKFLVGFLVVFLLIFILALIDLKRGVPMFNLGLPYLIENWIVLLLSFLSIVRVFWNIAIH